MRSYKTHNDFLEDVLATPLMIDFAPFRTRWSESLMMLATCTVSQYGMIFFHPYMAGDEDDRIGVSLFAEYDGVIVDSTQLDWPFELGAQILFAASLSVATEQLKSALVRRQAFEYACFRVRAYLSSKSLEYPKINWEQDSGNPRCFYLYSQGDVVETVTITPTSRDGFIVETHLEDGSSRLIA